MHCSTDSQRWCMHCSIGSQWWLIPCSNGSQCLYMHCSIGSQWLCMHRSICSQWWLMPFRIDSQMWLCIAVLTAKGGVQGSRNFELKISLDSRVTKYPPPPPPPPPNKKKQKQKQKNVVAKTNDIVIYASRCITTFPELSKVFFHFIFEEKPK